MKGWQIQNPMHGFLLKVFWLVTFRRSRLVIEYHDYCHGHTYFISLCISLNNKLQIDGKFARNQG